MQAVRLVLGALSISVITSATRLEAQQIASISGRIMTQAGSPIAEAEIGVLGTTGIVMSDSVGRFSLRDLTPGKVILRVRRVGYRPQHLRLSLGAGPMADLVVALEPGPHLLPGIEVTARLAKPAEYSWTTKYDDFFRRRVYSAGTFFTRQDMDRFGFLRLAEVIGHVPGARVRVRPPPLGTEIEFPRCSSGHVGIWLDGQKVNWQAEYQQAEGISLERLRRQPSFAELEADRRRLTVLAEVLDQIPMQEVEMMEVYRGVANIPAEFRDAGCGAIVLWRK